MAWNGSESKHLKMSTAYVSDSRTRVSIQASKKIQTETDRKRA